MAFVKQKRRTLRPPTSPRGRRVGELQPTLDALVQQFKTPAFIATDPLQFPHRYAEDPKTCEWVGFLAALLSYGRRDKILETMEGVLARMDHDPAGFLQGFSPQRDSGLFADFVYRFNRGEDLVAVLARLQRVYTQSGSLEAFFQQDDTPQTPLQERLGGFMDRFIALGKPPGPGLRFLLAHPHRGGACKRLHMFLRWMVRQDGPGPDKVDLGIWHTALAPRELLIPLDTHVGQMARRLQLTDRNANDWQTAEEITAVLRQWCPEDPIRYDFALFGFGVSGHPATQQWDLGT